MGIWGRLHICFQQLLQIQERKGGKVRKLLASELIHFILHKRKNLLGKNERIGLRKKGTETKSV